MSVDEALAIAGRGKEVCALVSAGSDKSWKNMMPITLRELLGGCLFFADEEELLRDPEELDRVVRNVRSPEEVTEYLVKSMETFEEKYEKAAAEPVPETEPFIEPSVGERMPEPIPEEKPEEEQPEPAPAPEEKPEEKQPEPAPIEEEKPEEKQSEPAPVPEKQPEIKNLKVKIQGGEEKKAHGGAKLPKPDPTYEVRHKAPKTWPDDKLAVLGRLRYDDAGNTDWTYDQLKVYFGCSDTQEIVDQILQYQARKEELKPLADKYIIPKGPGRARFKTLKLKEEGKEEK